MDGRRTYLDNAATTPCDPRVVEAMLPYLREEHGNPSSLHSAGRRARAAVDRARERLAGLLGAQSEEVVFTASGTEAINLALRGVMAAGGHLVVSAIEHPAVLETARALERSGVELSVVPCRPDGVVAAADLEPLLRPNTRLVSIMAANNVVGTLQPTAELARVAHAVGALFHADAVQLAGKLPLDVAAQDIDLLSLSAHKFHGPQGVGALVVRRGVELEPLVIGGGQERGLRSATENVAGIVGFGRAAAVARSEMADDAARLVGLRERIVEEVLQRIPNAYAIGDRWRRLPGAVALGFAGQEGEAIRLLLALDEQGIAVSSGSACSAHHPGEPSHVLVAMGLDPIRARGALRITLGRFTSEADVDHLLEVLPRAVAALRPITTRA